MLVRFLFFVCATLAFVRVAGASDDAKQSFDLRADTVETALKNFSAQSGCQVIVPTDLAAGVRTKTVRGRFTAREALDRLLAGTGLVAAQDERTGAFAVKKGTVPNAPRAARPSPARPAIVDEPVRPVTPAVPPENGSTTGEADVVELSPFFVKNSGDVGYVAENTLAGSRLNTRLRDTAASVSVFTREFLDDTGISDLSELLAYTVNSEIETNESKPEPEQNPYINGSRLNAGILIRGLLASQGMDYFSSITPTDPYRSARYEDSRGPNSILFGIGSPGGLLNQSSKAAALHRDTATIRHSSGSSERNRTEIDGNKVLIKDRLAVSLAALHQENGGWRQDDFQDKDRLFGAMTFRPLRTLTITAMGETGRDSHAVIGTSLPFEQALAWYDNREAFGVEAVTVAPTTALPNATLQARGIVERNGAVGGLNHRATFIENDGTVFDAIGTYLTRSYNSPAVRHPDGTPGTSGTALRINDPSFYPADNNAGGPGMYRAQRLHNYTFTVDWQTTRNLVFNLGHNYQETRASVYLMTGAEPVLRGEPNRTLGVGGAPNPYAGRLYFDGNWRNDVHYGDYKETRLSASYSFDTRSKWLGRHRFAGLLSRTDQLDRRAISWLSLAGRPFNATPSHVNNRIAVRNYLTEGDHGTYRAGNWRSLPSTVRFGGQEYGLVFANEVAGANNSGAEQIADSGLAVVQSHWLNNRLVTTFGFRRDEVEITEFGYTVDPVIGDVVDTNPAHGKATEALGKTHTAGAVFHVSDWLSLIANRSTNIGLPSFVRTVFPEGNLPPPSRGRGEDYGIGLDLLEGRISSRFVYFRSSEKGRIDTPGFSGAAGRNNRVMDALGAVLAAPGGPISAGEWATIHDEYTPPVSAVSSDFESEGYEARIIANLTANWRLVANYSYTDSGRTNLAAEMVQWYGLKAGADRPLQQGVSQNAAGQFVVDPSAYAAGGTVAKWLELAARHPATNPSTLVTGTGLTLAEEIFNLVDVLNDDKQQQEKRWGVRPHKISFFTAYDFKSGLLRGFSVGGGWRWRSANIIGTDAGGNEITGRALTAADLMLGYTRKFKRLPGRVRFQINIANLFDQTDVIPTRLATSEVAPNGLAVPGGRGTAYSRYDLVAPRSFRFTTTYSF